MKFRTVRSKSPFLVAIGSLLAVAASPAGLCGPQEAAIYEEISDIVAANFFDEELAGEPWAAIVERRRARAGASAGDAEFAAVMSETLAELKASHTAYFGLGDPRRLEIAELFGLTDEAIRAERNDDGVIVYNTIGAALTDTDEGAFVSHVFIGSTAHRAGLLEGDEIVSIDGDAPTPRAILEAAPGAKIDVWVRRSSSTDSARLFEIEVESIVPSEMFLRSMRDGAQVLQDGDVSIAHVRIWSYAGLKFQELLVELATTEPLASADGLIVDLRGGWGGAMPDYLSFFDQHPPVLRGIPRDGEPYTYDPHWRKPAALLIDGDSRSGKEVVAYGFRKHDLGILVGTRTGGAVLGGRPYVLSNGAILYLAVHDVEVDGERLEGRGVAPHVRVERALPYAQGRDPQLEAAVSALADRVRAGA